MIKRKLKNNIIDKIPKHKSRNKPKAKQIIYFDQVTAQEEPKALKGNLLSKDKFIFQYIIIILFIKASFSFCNCLSEVTLKTKESGDIQILSQEFFSKYRPSTININDSPQDIKITHTLNSESTIIITWDIKITSTKEMFSNCRQIVEIDLSNFDTSEVIDMNSMFFQCRGLILLNLSNFDTSKVTDMGYMFSSRFI